MKTKCITALFLLCVGIAQGQTEKKKTTVRIKKVEVVDGEKKITDTTYVMDNEDNRIPSDLRVINHDISNENGVDQEIIVVEDALPPLEPLAPLSAVPDVKP